MSKLHPYMATIFFLLSAAVVADATPLKSPISPAWLIIAQSDLVACARVSAPMNLINEQIKSKKYDYVEIKVDVKETYKGSKPSAPLKVRYFTRPASYSPPASLLNTLNEKEAIVFLVKVDDPAVAGYYFAGYSPAAISEYKQEDAHKLRLEVQTQEHISKNFDSEEIGKADSSDAKVRQLFAELTNSSTQRSSWETLLKLPKSSMPAVVRAMNDHRSLAEQYAKVPNPPGFFEAFAQYSPQCVLDAAGILLNHKTSTSIHQTANGGSDRERQEELNGWRIWAYYNF